MTDAIDLGEELDKLAGEMIAAAAKPDVKLSEKMEVFKTVSSHYVNVSKVKGKRPARDTGADGPTMGALRSSIDSAANQPGQGDDDDQTSSRE